MSEELRKKLLLRLDQQVYDAVARWAADDLRSVNAQIEHALRSALRTAGRWAPGGAGAADTGGAQDPLGPGAGESEGGGVSH